MIYQIRQVKNRVYNLKQSENSLGTLEFTKWNSSNATVNLLGGKIKFIKKGFWSANYFIIQEDQLLGKITSNWKGQFIIHLLKHPTTYPNNLDTVKENSYQTTLIIRSKGFFKMSYEIYKDGSIEPTTLITPKSKWFKTNYDLEFLQPDSFSIEDKKIFALIAYSQIIMVKRRIIIIAASSAVLASS